MTDLLTTDHADSGEIVRLHPSIVDTYVLDLGETILYRRPVADLGAAHVTGELPLWPTGAELAVQASPPAPAVYHPAVADVRKPFLGRGSHRAANPPWAWALLGAGALAVGEFVAGLAVLAVAW